MVIAPATEVFVVDALVFSAITKSKTTGVDSGVVRLVFFPALTNVFVRPGKVPVIRTLVVVANTLVVAAKTKVKTMKTDLFVEPAKVCVTKTEVPVTVALVNVITSLVNVAMSRNKLGLRHEVSLLIVTKSLLKATSLMTCFQWLAAIPDFELSVILLILCLGLCRVLLGLCRVELGRFRFSLVT